MVVLVDDAQHDAEQGHAEDVVGIGEESSAGDQDGANMIPAKGSLVDFGQGQTTTLVGVLDVSKVIVEVVEGVVPAGGLVLGHGERSFLQKLGTKRREVSRKDKSLGRTAKQIRSGARLVVYILDAQEGYKAEEAHLAVQSGSVSTNKASPGRARGK